MVADVREWIESGVDAGQELTLLLMREAIDRDEPVDPVVGLLTEIRDILRERLVVDAT